MGSLLLALAIHWLSRSHKLLITTAVSWFMAFVMMWVVTANLGVLPLGILPYAIPLSLLECALAGWIIRIHPPQKIG